MGNIEAKHPVTSQDKAKHPVTSQEALWNADESCWDNMSLQVLRKLVESMPS